MLIKRTLAAPLIAAALIVAACQNPAHSEADAPNDLQIAHTAYTAGAIDIRYAHLALAISDDLKVREFAELMLRDHAAVNEAALDLLARLEAAPEDNATSQTLLAQAADKRAELAGLTGSAFDLAYAENELAYHQFVNDTVENAFIPAAQNAEFKELLGVALATFQAHEGHAEMMVEELK